MKKLITICIVLLVVWLCVPTQASAGGPVTWQWKWTAYQQTVKEISGVVYEAGNPLPLHFSTVDQQLQRQGYYEQSWSVVGGSSVVYHYYVKFLRISTPVFPIIMMAPTFYLREHNPLFFGMETV